MIKYNDRVLDFRFSYFLYFKYFKIGTSRTKALNYIKKITQKHIALYFHCLPVTSEMHEDEQGRNNNNCKLIPTL